MTFFNSRRNQAELVSLHTCYMVFYLETAITTTRSWQRSWALRSGRSASVGQGWKERLQAVTRIRDTELWQTPGSARHLDFPPAPRRKKSEIGNTAYICTSNMCYLHGLSILPDWYCEAAVIDEGTACLCPRGNIGECICFPLPVYTEGIPCGKETVITWSTFDINLIHKALQLTAPAPESSVEDLGEEERLYPRDQTTHSQ